MTTNRKTVLLKKLRLCATLPAYAHADDAGADLASAVNVTLEPKESKLIPTGIALAIPQGYEGQVRPRSGLALKHQVTVLNSPGTIDAGYRGEVGVILINHGRQPFGVTVGMRIAQLVIAPVVRGDFENVSDLGNSMRNNGGFGSTGE